MKKRLIHILMSAAVLGLIFPAAAKASTITFTLNYTFSGQTQHAKVFTSGGVQGYDFALNFPTVVAPFTLTVVADDNPNLSNVPPGYTCVPIGNGTNCILFTVTASNVGWVGDYNLNIAWDFDTNSLYPNTPVNQTGLGQIRILKFDGSGFLDITVPNSYCSTCGIDPGIGGQSDNFSSFLVASTPTSAVPEPTTLVLLGSGVGALLMRRRRRQV